MLTLFSSLFGEMVYGTFDSILDISFLMHENGNVLVFIFPNCTISFNYMSTVKQTFLTFKLIV